MGSIYEKAKSTLPAPVRKAIRGAVGGELGARLKLVRQAVSRPHAQPEPVREAVQRLLDEVQIEGIVRKASRKFAALKGRKNLKLHLGAGPDTRTGWINIDLALVPPSEVDEGKQPDSVFINYDLRRGLPLEDASCSYIYSSHFFEHLEYRQVKQLLRECYRILEPGGVFRACLPNFKGMFAAYLRGDDEYFSLHNIPEILPEVEPGTEALVDHVNYGVYQNGEHKWIMDEEKIELLLKRTGFASVVESTYQEEIDRDLDVRRRYSFYVDAFK
jgi:predicted SAM-dependent methyltransferase